jgi:hypothetical protein
MVCEPAECKGKVYDCGNCVDDDVDQSVDMADIQCWGPCDNNEEGWKGEIPGQNNAPCKMDCYFDFDSGSGNDDCYWSHECDIEQPTLPDCPFDSAANIPGTGMSCAEAYATQSQDCLDICMPLVPNGCDCFGCCLVQIGGGEERTVYIGTEDDSGDGTCSKETVADELLCEECTQVIGCLNECEECEICFGETEPPPGCDEPECPPGVDPCTVDPLGGDDCPPGYYCLTGCCAPEPG